MHLIWNSFAVIAADTPPLLIIDLLSIAPTSDYLYYTHRAACSQLLPSSSIVRGMST